jgi:UPF0042 nucleotide-binding protein
MSESRSAPHGNEALPAAAPAAPRTAGQSVLLITGMSGAGKTTALKAFEDLGFECIDNLPLRLFRRLVRRDATDAAPIDHQLAIGVDVRTRDFGIHSCLAAIDDLQREEGISIKLVFLYCDDEEVRRRYTTTRHRHPLAGRLPLIEGIARERQILAPLRKRAELAIDTTGLSPGHLKRLLRGHFGLPAQQSLLVQVTSFSFRSGLPRDADLVFDVRFLANPYYEPSLKSLTGRDAEIARFIRANQEFAPFLESLTRLLHPLLPRYVAEGKSYLTIAIGCTGGRHRSVYVAEELAAWLRSQGQRVEILHRDLDRSSGRDPDQDTRAP